MTLGERANYIRSKNAGPFWMTIDIFCGSDAAYDQIGKSEALSSESIAGIFKTNAEAVRRFDIPALHVIKISMPRPYPQGSRHERDIHSGQQYVQILDLEL